MTIQVEISDRTAIEAITVKMMLEKIAKNFDKKNIAKIAELSEIPNANTKIEKLFNNPLFKMAL